MVFCVCVCETRSFLLRADRSLKVFMNLVLGEVLRPKRWEVAVEQRKLHNEEYYDVNFQSNIYYTGGQMKEDERWGACGTNGAEGDVHPRFWWGI